MIHLHSNDQKAFHLSSLQIMDENKNKNKMHIAFTNLGLCYEKGVGVKADLQKAIYLYHKGADHNDPHSQYKLGEYYIEKKTTEKKAMYYLRLAAAQDHPFAFRALGVYYGDSVEPWPEGFYKAMKLFLFAANLGCVKAQCWVSQLTKNPKEESYFARKAAEVGYAKGQYILANCYARGRGLRRDVNEARFWYYLAVQQGECTETHTYKSVCD